MDHDQKTTTNCVVKVRAQIVYSNKEERAVAEEFAKAAQAYWNNQKVTAASGEVLKFDVQFNIVKSDAQLSGVDTLIAHTTSGRSLVNMTLAPGSGGLQPDTGDIFGIDNTGNPSGFRGIAPHETGHLMGLRDLYAKGEKVPILDGPQGDIMRYAQPHNNARSAWWVLSPNNGNTTIIRTR